MTTIQIELPDATAHAARGRAADAAGAGAADQRRITTQAGGRLVAVHCRPRSRRRYPADVDGRDQRGSKSRARRAQTECGRSLIRMCCCPGCCGVARSADCASVACTIAVVPPHRPAPTPRRREDAAAVRPSSPSTRSWSKAYAK